MSASTTTRSGSTARSRSTTSTSEFHCDLPDEDYHTVAGFVFGELGRAAEPGDEVSHDGLRFLVDSVEGQRIERLTVTFQPWHHREAPVAGDEPGA